MKALNTGAATYPETADYYIRDASGNIMTTYRRKNSQVSSVWNTEIRAYEQALYGSDRLGVYIPWTLTYTGKLDDLGGYTYPTANEIKHERTLNYRWMNNKRYELKDHLGNVHATLGDYRLSTVSGSGPYTYGSFSADQKSMYNYYSFGMPKYGQDQWYEANDQPASMGTTTYTYRFGFNGQEKVNEIAGTGNHNTALFWEYDTRLGRRWNIDPHADRYPSMSGYSAFANNPINVIDPDGRDIIPVHGTWAKPNTWQNLKGIALASNNLFGDKNMGMSFKWSGGNYAQSRTEAALGLINHVRVQMQSKTFNGEITLVGHSHGGNVSIEALNMMAEMKEFDNVQLNLLTINTPVRDDYQLSEKATGRVNHVNVYDPKDPVQSRGGNSTVVLPDLPSTPDFMDVNTKGTGEFGSAGRTFNNAKNIQVDNPQGITNGSTIWGGIPIPKKGDFHNSHNRVNDWIKKTEEK